MFGDLTPLLVILVLLLAVGFSVVQLEEAVGSISWLLVVFFAFIVVVSLFRK